MKIAKQTHKKSLVIICSTIAILAISGIAGAYYFKVGPFTTNTINMSQPSDEETQAGIDIKKQSVEQTANGGKVSTGSDPAPAPQPIEGSEKKSVDMKITAANQDSSMLYIRAMIQTVADSGTCSLTMIGPNNKQYTTTADTQALPSSSTCQGFNIPLSELTEGSWKVTIEFNNNTLTASTNKDITIQ